jgi:arylsulfatase
MIGNRGVYHEGWTAVTRHGIPWEMVDTPKRPFDEDVWELYDHSHDWSQAHDLAEQHPERLADLQAAFQREAEKFNVLPLDDRVTERENPEVAGRLDLHGGRSTLSFGPRVGRLSEEAAPNVKNRSHVITADLELVTGTSGVVVAQGGRFGGWSLYVVDGVPHYAYNYVGRDLTVVRGSGSMAPGRHDLVVRFDYDGGPPGGGASVRLEVDGTVVGSGRIPATTAYYFSFDETFNIGVDRGTPVVDDYLPVRNRFEGLIHRVRFDYDGGPPGSGAAVTLEVDGTAVGAGRIAVTTAYYFSFDETFNVGVDRGTPVVDDYLPVRNRFEGLIHRVRFDLGPVSAAVADEDVARAHLTHQ